MGTAETIDMKSRLTCSYSCVYLQGGRSTADRAHRAQCYRCLVPRKAFRTTTRCLVPKAFRTTVYALFLLLHKGFVSFCSSVGPQSSGGEISLRLPQHATTALQ